MLKAFENPTLHLICTYVTAQVCTFVLGYFIRHAMGSCNIGVDCTVRCSLSLGQSRAGTGYGEQGGIVSQLAKTARQCAMQPQFLPPLWVMCVPGAHG